MSAEYPDKTIGIGIVAGFRKLYVNSNKYYEDYPQNFEQTLKRLIHLENSLLRKVDNSNNKHKAEIVTNTCRDKVFNQKKDYINKKVLDIVIGNDVICVENLKHDIRFEKYWNYKSKYNIMWFDFIKALEYKAKQYEKTLIKVDTCFPLSQKCSVCDHYNVDIKKIKSDGWVCENCQSVNDRDSDDAIFVLMQGINIFRYNMEIKEFDYVKDDLILLQKEYEKLGYIFDLDDCYTLWKAYSEYCSAGWMYISNVENSIKFLKSIKR